MRTEDYIKRRLTREPKILVAEWVNQLPEFVNADVLHCPYCNEEHTDILGVLYYERYELNAQDAVFWGMTLCPNIEDKSKAIIYMRAVFHNDGRKNPWFTTCTTGEKGKNPRW